MDTKAESALPRVTRGASRADTRLARLRSLLRKQGFAGGHHGNLLSAEAASRTTTVEMVRNDAITPVFEATVQATEESIINALIAAEDMHGRDDHVVPPLPHHPLRHVLRKHNRLITK
ncbi:MAG TPA: P1 family peptidase [Terriglobales bacterium]|nr:P1 family peptidase [Terriglobales bacterium]